MNIGLEQSFFSHNFSFIPRTVTYITPLLLILPHHFIVTTAILSHTRALAVIDASRPGSIFISDLISLSRLISDINNDSTKEKSRQFIVINRTDGFGSIRTLNRLRPRKIAIHHRTRQMIGIDNDTRPLRSTKKPD